MLLPQVYHLLSLSGSRITEFARGAAATRRRQAVMANQAMPAMATVLVGIIAIIAVNLMFYGVVSAICKFLRWIKS